MCKSLRHAGPARAEVQLTYGPEHLVVEVSHDGWGISPVIAAGLAEGGEQVGATLTGGNGLRGMRERAETYWIP
jgi:signal transduction histidine kinase